MQRTLLLLLSASTTAFRAAPRVPLPSVRRAPAVVAAASADEEVATQPQPEPETIFTLQEREDGWNDVRGAIKTGIKERTKPWQDINRDYVTPVRKWSAAIAEVTAETVVNVPNISSFSGVVVPTGGVPGPPQFSKEGAIEALGGLLDAAADAREAKAAKAAPAPLPAPKVDKSVESGANFVLLLGVPAVTLLVIGPYLLAQLTPFL